MNSEQMAQFITQAVTEAATGLYASRISVLSCAAGNNTLRVGVSYPIEDQGIRDSVFTVDEINGAEQALRTGQIRILASPQTQLPDALRAHFQNNVFLLPVTLGERRLALIIGEANADVSLRSPEWQTRAMEIAARSALVIELSRAASAYQNELQIRQAGHQIISSILGGRPLPEIAEEIVDFVGNRLNESRIGMFLRREDSRFYPLALQNISSEYGDQVSQLPTISPYLRRAHMMSAPYHALNVQIDPEVSEAQRARFKREKITSILITPLLLGNALKGTLVLYPREGRVFTPSEITLLKNFADQATMAISITQQLTREREGATLEERNRLAREIHDTVASSLTSVVLQVKTAETALQSGDIPLAQTMISEALQHSAKALNETRRAVYGMVPETLSRQTASQSIEEETEKFALETGIETPFIRSGTEVSLSTELRLAALRIVQEALNNAKKHAGAKRVRVGIQFHSENVVLMIQDDGVGFDSSASKQPDEQGGYGLFGMTERARLLGGDVHIESTPGWGTLVRATLPYHPSERARPETLKQSEPLLLPPPPEKVSSTTSTVDSSGVEKLRVLIADDHPVVRNGIKTALEMEGSILIVGEASDGEQAYLETKRLSPDAVLMDLQMPHVDGLEGLRRIHAEMPEMPVVILTTFFNETSVADSLRAGARGYLLKDASAVEIADALRAARRGETRLSTGVNDSLSTFSGTAPNVNEREREVLQLVAQGARNKEIANSLFITVSTVEKHIASLFHKLEATNRAELVRTAISRGLVFPGMTK